MLAIIEKKKNFLTQYKLIMIIKILQIENFILKQKNEELSNELEEMKDNIGAKKLIL